MVEGPLEVVQDREPSGRGPRPFLIPGANQLLGTPLAEVVQLRGAAPPAVVELGDPCRGVLRGLLSGVWLGGVLLGHGRQRAVNSASITSSESSDDDSELDSAVELEAP